MMETYVEIFRRLARPLAPIATDTQPVLEDLPTVRAENLPTARAENLPTIRAENLPTIRAVLFDVYGTMLVSGSGEVGTVRRGACEEALAEALAAMGLFGAGLSAAKAAGQGVQSLIRAIEVSHEQSHGRGIDYPEVDIVEIWRQIIAELAGRGLIDGAAAEGIDPKRLAVEYEARANPCWPMPGLAACLTELRERGIVLGIVSNAQFYTPLLFEALLDTPAADWGVLPDLQIYSYRFGRAKPDLELHRMAAEALDDRGIAAGETLYVGNDMLNDIYPAVQVGFRTALFAGDARSLRCRSDDPRVKGIHPDLVLMNLIDILRRIIP